MVSLFLTLLICGYFTVVAGVLYFLFKELKSEILFASPIIGGAVLSIFTYLSVFLSGGSLTVSGFVWVVLFVFGVLGWRTFLKSEQRQCNKAIIQKRDFVYIFILILVVALPLSQHVVPPDVDAQYTTTTAAYLLAGDLYPNLELFSFSGNADRHKVLLPDTFALNLATASQLAQNKLTLFAIAFASAWSSITLIALLPIAQRLLCQEYRTYQTLLLVLACGLSAPFLWNYGDGSYTRTPGIAVFVALPIFWTMLEQKKVVPFSILSAILLSSLFYVHQRYAIVVSFFTFIMFLAYLVTHPKLAAPVTLKAAAIMGVSTILLTLPLAHNFFNFASEGTGTFIGNAELNRTTAEILSNFTFRFHSAISWLLVAIGLVFTFRKLKCEVLFIAAFVQIITFIYFTIPPLIGNITPFLVPFAYARVVALSPIVFGKFVFVASFIIIFARWLSEKSKLASHRAKFVITILGWLTVFTLIFPILKIIELYFFSASFRFSRLELTAGFLTVWAPALVSFLLIIFLAYNLLIYKNRNPAKISFGVLLFFMTSAYFAYDVRKGVIHHPYSHHNLFDISDWFVNNTSASETLIFKGCNIDPFGTNIAENRPTNKRNTVRYEWPLDWLPALAQRKTLCNAIHLVGGFSGVFGAGFRPPIGFYSAHRVLYGTANKNDMKQMSKLGLTHIIDSPLTRWIRGGEPLPQTTFQRVYSQGKNGYEIYIFN